MVDFFGKVSEGALVNLFGTGLAQIGTQVRNVENSAVIRSLFNKGDVRVVLSHAGQIGEGDAVGVGDVMALIELLGHGYNLTNLRDSFSFFSSLNKDGDVKQNLITIGGPAVNPLTGGLLDSVVNATGRSKDALIEAMRLKRDALNQFLDSGRGGKSFDVGVIIKTKNPYERNSEVLIVFGWTGYGTWGAMRFVFSDELKKKIKTLQGNYFECMVKVEVQYNCPQLIVIDGFRELEW
jgi:hypothetical protein